MSSKACSSLTSQSPTRDDISPSCRTITCNVQLTKAGCLPGEIVPLIVTIAHTKPIRSLNGVIVTLYRQARTEMHPCLPVAAGGKGEKYEDYYPRSKSGLGGLSLSAAGSSQVWRKDLSQTFAPLYVNPQTMSTEVKVAIRVPDDAFPSIRTAPGEMISFKYYVEVIIDVHGKLAGHANAFPNVNMTGGHSILANSPAVGFSSDSREHSVTVWGNGCIDTSTIQREKNAVVITSQLILGTHDSMKARGKKKQADYFEQAIDSTGDHGTVHEIQPNGSNRWDRRGFGQNDPYDGCHDGYELNDYDHNHEYTNGDDQAYYDDSYYGGNLEYSPHPNFRATRPDATDPVPLPAPEGSLSEKQRLQRAEEALLPSRPPDSNDAVQSVSTTQHIPSAPYLPDETELDSPHADQNTIAGRHVYRCKTLQDMTTNDLEVDPGPDHPVPCYSAHAFQSTRSVRHDLSEGGPNLASTRDDKQELERYQLQSLASSPHDSFRLCLNGGTPHSVHTDDDPRPSAPPADQFEDMSLEGGSSAPGAHEAGLSATIESRLAVDSSKDGSHLHQKSREGGDLCGYQEQPQEQCSCSYRASR